jgi:hypothetical protein
MPSRWLREASSAASFAAARSVAASEFAIHPSQASRHGPLGWLRT